MIVGRIEFGPEIVLTPKARNASVEVDFPLGFWKLLGLEVSVDMAPDDVCLDEAKMKIRNELVARRRADKCN